MGELSEVLHVVRGDSDHCSVSGWGLPCLCSLCRLQAAGGRGSDRAELFYSGGGGQLAEGLRHSLEKLQIMFLEGSIVFAEHLVNV